VQHLELDAALSTCRESEPGAACQLGKRIFGSHRA
jgi:hypothetical protein